MGNTRLGAKLKELRIRVGYTQQFVADKLYLKNKSTLASWESGKSEPDAITLLKLCELYDVPYSQNLAVALGINNKIGSDESQFTLENNHLENIEGIYPLTDTEVEFIKIYRNLDRNGQDLIRQQFYMANQIYKKQGDSISSMETG